MPSNFSYTVRPRPWWMQWTELNYWSRSKVSYIQDSIVTYIIAWRSRMDSFQAPRIETHSTSGMYSLSRSWVLTCSYVDSLLLPHHCSLHSLDKWIGKQQYSSLSLCRQSNCLTTVASLFFSSVACSRYFIVQCWRSCTRSLLPVDTRSQDGS